MKLRLMICTKKEGGAVRWVEPCLISYPEGIETSTMHKPRAVQADEVVTMLDLHLSDDPALWP